MARREDPEARTFKFRGRLEIEQGWGDPDEQRPAAGAEVEGHGGRFPQFEVEGHGGKFPQRDAEVEGHGGKFPQRDAEVEGHGGKLPQATLVLESDEVEGHALRFRGHVNADGDNLEGARFTGHNEDGEKVELVFDRVNAR